MSDADDPTESTPTTESVDVGDAAPGLEPSAAVDPVRTVTRKGAAVGMAGALLAGGLIGWLGAGAFDDEDSQPISAFQEGPFGQGQGPGGMPGGFPGGGGGFPGGPGGEMPGGGHGPGGSRGDEGDHPMPPWMDEDGDDPRDEYDDSEDRGSEDRDDQSEDEDEDQEQPDGQDQSDDA